MIEIEQDALLEGELKQYSYAMIGYAYEELKDHESAKENYALALSHDQCCEIAIEGLSRVYAADKDYDVAYEYVIKGLYQVKDEDFSVSPFLKTIMAFILKVLRPSKSYRKIRAETEQMDQSRNRWVAWATKYKEWYESNISDEKKLSAH